MIHRRELCAIAAGEMLLLALHAGGPDVMIAIRGHFRLGGTRVDAAAAAIEMHRRAAARTGRALAAAAGA